MEVGRFVYYFEGITPPIVVHSGEANERQRIEEGQWKGSATVAKHDEEKAMPKSSRLPDTALTIGC